MSMYATERYRNDPVFKGLVDTIEMMLERTDGITPTEVREAVTLATMKYEMRHVRPIAIMSEREKLRWINSVTGEPEAVDSWERDR